MKRKKDAQKLPGTSLYLIYLIAELLLAFLYTGAYSIIGVPIGLYLPDRKTAIEFYKPHGNKALYRS